MICVECGKEIEILKDGLCLNCYIKSKAFTKGPDSINVIKCSNCNEFKFQNKWENQSLNSIIYNHILQKFKISSEFKNPDININITDDKNPYKKQLIIIIKGHISNLEVIEKHLINVNIKREICDICSKKFGGYHEAIIQIRATKRNLSSIEIESINSLIQDFTEKMQYEGNKQIFIADFQIHQNGLDYFISDNNFALSIIQKLQELYGGNITKSSKNIGMKDSRQVYRMTYLLRLYQYKEGDILSNNNKFYYVKKIFKNKILLIDLENWDENNYQSKKLDNFKIKGGDELKNKMILLSQTRDEVQVMNQNNFKIFNIKKPKMYLFSKEIIEIIQIQDKMFLLPI
jgi:nonsense-mediated mRNA decay protein 3